MMKSLRTFAAVVCGLLSLPLLAADLPSGYGEVDYIRADGNQCINTDYYFSYATNMEVEVDVALDGTGQSSIFYSRNLNGNRSVEILMRSDQYIRFSFGSSQNIIVPGRQYVPYNRRLYKFKNGAFYLDGVLITNLTATAYDMNKHLQLFSNYDPTKNPYTYGDKTSGKLYGARAWIDNNGTREQVMDLVPATNSTGVAGMYDVIRDRFFTSGSGTDFIAPTGGTIYSVKNDESNSLTLGTIWDGGAAPVPGKDYVVTNQVVLKGSTSKYKPNFFPGDSLQLGEVGGSTSRYNVDSSRYSCVPNLILANGTFYARGGFIAGGISTVISKSDAPFKVSEGWANLTFTAGHEFRGAEDTMLLIGQQSNNANKYKLTIEDGSPRYYGKWKGTGISRVVLKSPAALGGERETFAADALFLTTTSAAPSTPDNLTIDDTSHYIFTFDFDGKMPSKGRGITLSRPNRMLELVVPPGRTVRCDMPVVVNDQTSKPNYVMIHNDSTLGTEGEASRFSLGDWNGGRLMVSNVAVRISNVGESTATTLAVSNNAAFWAEVDSTNGCFYSQISANTTLETAEAKIKILLDYANTVEVDGEQVVKEAVEIPVLKIDTSVRTVTPSDFVLADGSTKFTKGSQKFAVRTEGTTQTVYWVADSKGLIIIFR